MTTLRIEGRHLLSGEITASGNKNAALPMMTACLMTDEPVILHNLPDIGDVRTMRSLLASLGVELEELAPTSWKLQAREVRQAELDPDRLEHDGKHVPVHDVDDIAEEEHT